MKKVVLWFVAAVALGMFLAVAGAAVYAHRVTESFHSWESPAPAPLKTFHFTRRHNDLQDFIVMTEPGTTLSSVGDMSVFGAATPGLSPEEFRARFGASSIVIHRFTVEAAIERHSSGSLVAEWKVLYASPLQSEPPVAIEAVVHPEIAARIRRAHYGGYVHIHNGSSTGFLGVWVTGTGKVEKLRWVGAA
jgi:hypothetical protein